VVLIDDAEGSQFDAAMLALKQGVDLPDGLVCVALAGKRHRGQRARPWTALRGNLHLTAHYRIDAPAPHVETGLTLLPAIASASAIAEATNGRAPVGIKWVNDILIRDRKVSGVLTATHVQGERVERAIFGIGINVAVAPSIEPTPFVPAAGSLAEYDVSVPTVLTALIGQLDSLVAQLKEGGSTGLFPRYRARADFIGREVSIWPENCDDWRSARPLLSGRVIDLLPDLSLVIEGQPQPVRRGRMAYQLG
jgi:BirA family biotin operon repressor/biotin-[acetyl-CoA-carboxylase] ligase